MEKLDKIKKIYFDNENFMVEILATTECSEIDKHLTLEEAFELYKLAMAWSGEEEALKDEQ